jgi:hypothetical protein
MGSQRRELILISNSALGINAREANRRANVVDILLLISGMSGERVALGAKRYDTAFANQGGLP